MTTFDPTDEQMDALGHFNTGRPLAIEAGAGTGKTSTLALLAESTTCVGQYLAFNKALVQDARNAMPMNVDCSTAHSLAFRAVGKEYAHRMDSKRLRSWDLAKRLDLGPLLVQYGSERKMLQPGYLASLVMRGITRFCQTADEKPLGRHLPYVDGIDEPGPNGRTYKNNDELQKWLEPTMQDAWADLQKLDGKLPFKHEHYLKIYERREPKVSKSFILFDEAQDASPVLISIVEQQKHAQIVWVGDSAQAIYGFTGAVNAFELIADCDRTFLTQSFRFGQDIADIANLLLGEMGSEMELRGLPSIDSDVGFAETPSALLCRTNAVAVESVLAFQKRDLKPHLVGGGEDVLYFANAAERLMDGQKTNHHDLACFSSWGEVCAYVADDPQGDELRLLVKLVNDYGVDTIREALDGMIAERRADVIVSTAHKSKGREWPVVKLAGDFPDQDGVMPSDAELRLVYVAATRAQRHLDPTLCGPIRELLGLNKEEPPCPIPTAQSA